MTDTIQRRGKRCCASANAECGSLSRWPNAQSSGGRARKRDMRTILNSVVNCGNLKGACEKLSTEPLNLVSTKGTLFHGKKRIGKSFQITRKVHRGFERDGDDLGPFAQCDAELSMGTAIWATGIGCSSFTLKIAPQSSMRKKQYSPRMESR